MSAILPKGMRNTAVARRYAVATQLNSMAFIMNSAPMEGRAMLTEELINAVTKEPIAATNTTTFLLTSLFK